MTDKLINIKSTILGVLTILLFLNTFYCNTLPQSKKEIKFWMAYTLNSFREVNPPDASAAVKVYAESLKDRIAKHYQKIATFTATIYDSDYQIEEAYKAKKLDLLSLTSEEYFRLKKKLNIYPLIATIAGDDAFEQYLLIVRNDINITKIPDLKGKRLAISNPNFNPMLKEWLFNLLSKNNMPDINGTFEKVKTFDKESNAVYDVFFKNSDCSIVRKKVYSTLCELNPQIKNMLAIITSSEPMVLIFAAANAFSDQDLYNTLLEEIKDFHLTRGGKNMLNIFKSQKFIRVYESDLQSVKNILDENESFRKKLSSK